MSYDKELKNYLYQFLSENRKAKFEEVLSERTRHFAIALEDIYQSHNASAVVRSADCFGIQDVYTIETINDFTPSKGVSKGAVKWIDMNSYGEYKACYKDLRSKGYQIVATTPHTDDCNLDDFDFTKKSVIFFGSEKEGICQETKDEADVFLKIPMQGFTESLNISVSAAIVMQKITAQLKLSEIDWQLSEEEKEELRLDWAKKTVQRINMHLKEFDKNYS
ncbi:MAG: tRNA (guanosine-2'-O-)-methyltransferase [Planctomycetota bacterium]|jgi:tRNA (guanosine-2'-O-)-methyltransferase